MHLCASTPSRGGSARAETPAWLPYAIIGLLALLGRVWGITRTEVWRDEAITLLHMRTSWWDLATRLAFVEDTPPLSFFVFKAWWLVSDHVLWMRTLPVLLGIVTVWVLMRWAALWHRSAVWSVGLLAAFSHVLLQYSQELRAYSLVLLLVASGLWYAERSVRRGGTWRSWLIPALLAALAAHAHVSAIFVYPMLLAYVLIREPGRWRQWLLSPIHLVWLAAVGPVVWFSAYWAHQHVVEANWWIRPLTTQQFGEIVATMFGLEPALQCEQSADSLRTLWWMFALERLVILVTAPLAVLAWLNPQTRHAALALAFSAVVFSVCLVVSSFISLPNVLIRTLLPAWIPIVLLLGLGGIGWGKGARRWLGPSLMALLTLFYAGGWLWLIEEGKPRRVPADAVYRWIRERLSPDDIVISTPPWYEDQLAYGLGDILRGERMFTIYMPAYQGLPARHRLAHRRPDPHWQTRLRDLIAARDATASEGGAFIVVYGVNWKHEALEEIQAIVEATMKEAEKSPDFGLIQVTRFAPVKMAESVPAAHVDPSSAH